MVNGPRPSTRDRGGLGNHWMHYFRFHFSTVSSACPPRRHEAHEKSRRRTFAGMQFRHRVTKSPRKRRCESARRDRPCDSVTPWHNIRDLLVFAPSRFRGLRFSSSGPSENVPALCAHRVLRVECPVVLIQPTHIISGPIARGLSRRPSSCSRRCSDEGCRRSVGLAGTSTDARDRVPRRQSRSPRRTSYWTGSRC